MNNFKFGVIYQRVGQTTEEALFGNRIHGPAMERFMESLGMFFYGLLYLRREGTLGCLLHFSPKFYNNVFLFVSLTTLGAFIEF